MYRVSAISGKSLVAGAMLWVGAVFLGGCYNDNEEDLYPDQACNTTEVGFAGTIGPILSNNCLSCHGDRNNGGSGGGINLEGYSNVKIYVDNGLLLSAVKHDGNASPMPKGGKLSACQISQIEAWIVNGAANN